ncbi:MAG: glycosyltransferase family 4 protein [Melioribacteraceae bacterium]|nr:MAG: glycosyltransferase family 4 protein [Melioribacteraceae bacterium]
MKKVLIITYYWPPAGGPGVQRVLKFAKYLPDFSWQPIILTVENGEYPAIDESLLDDIPPGIKVYKTKSFEPFNLYKGITGQKGNIPTHVLNKSENESALQKLSKWIRANVFIPDARVGWIPTIVKEGKNIIEKEKPDLIFSSSPPHSLQIGAMKLAKQTGLKWVADFRDPWTDGFWQKELPRTRYAIKKDSKLERKVLQSSNAVITVSDSIAELLDKKNHNSYHVIPNGYDEYDFANIVKSKSEKFTIVYTGSLRKSQIPNKFLRSLSELNSNNAILNLELHFIGTVHPDAVNLVNEFNLNKLVKFYSYKPHNELIKCIINADMLLLSIPNTQNNEGILTGKLFEYIGSNNFILCIGPKNGDAAKIISELNCGITFDFDEDTSKIVLEKYSQWEAGFSHTPEINSEQYTRKNLTKKLSSIFDSIL